MKSLILTTFLIHLVFSDSTEDKYNLEELCSKSYFDRLITTDHFHQPLDGKQVFHLYRSDPFNPGFHHYWKLTVERSGVNKALKAIPNKYLLDYTIEIKNNNTPNEWYSAVGFNALDNYSYALFEDKTTFDMNSTDRSQHVFRIKLNFHGWFYRPDGLEQLNVTLAKDRQFGKIPILNFLGIDCPKEEEPLISDEVIYYIFGVLLFFAIVLPITDLWLIANRNRVTQEIYDDSRLGSLSVGPPSATHSSEAGSVKLSSQRRIIDRRVAK